MIVRTTADRRSGSAAVEMALVFSLVMMPTLIGILEVGRLVMVQQIVANAAREGARFAAQGMTIDSYGNRVEIKTSTGNPSVKSVVYNYLYGAGLKTLTAADVTVSFTYTAPRSDGVAATEPYQGEKLQPFTVTVTVPFPKVRWIDFGFVTTSTVGFTTKWRSLRDDPFVIDQTLPSW